jgi:hypothetical protein
MRTSVGLVILSKKDILLSIWLRTIKCKWINLQHIWSCVCLDINYFSPVIMSEYTVQHVNMPVYKVVRKNLFESLPLYIKLHNHSTDLCTNQHGFCNHKPDFVLTMEWYAVPHELYYLEWYEYDHFLKHGQLISHNVELSYAWEAEATCI